VKLNNQSDPIRATFEVDELTLYIATLRSANQDYHTLYLDYLLL